MRSICEQRWITIAVVTATFVLATSYSESPPLLAVSPCPFTSIFSFGDSLADTGNLYLASHHPSEDCFLPPYGETFFHHVSGRCSDGRLIIDFIGSVSLFLSLLLLIFHSKYNLIKTYKKIYLLVRSSISVLSSVRCVYLNYNV